MKMEESYKININKNNRMSKAIKKSFKELCEYYDSYQDYRYKILNHPKILEYLFRNPLIKRDNLVEVIEVTNDEFNPVKISDTQLVEIDTLFSPAYIKIMKYQNKYNQYLLETNRNINLIKQLPMIPLTSPNIMIISKILFKMKIDHVINWSFKIEDEHVSALKVKPYIFDQEFNLDFFGIIFIETENDMIHKMILFAIEYDQSSKKIRIEDHLKQYYLRQMNVHLLRLNNKLNLVSEIKKFISRIKKTKSYVIKNGLKLPLNLNVSDELSQFYENYEYNHKLFLKYYDKNKNDDLELESDTEDDEGKPGDEASVVSKEFVKSLVRKKVIGKSSKLEKKIAESDEISDKDIRRFIYED
jgi:hypothetical protein